MRSSLCMLLALAAPLAAQYPLPTSDNDWADADAHVFLEHEVNFIEITMPEADLDAFLADPHLDTYVPCTVRYFNSVIDETHLNVGIRPRGNTARDHKKFPWKLSFNEFVPGRQFHGLEKLNVNSVAVDPSISRDSITFQIHREAGVPAPRTAHVWLKINDGSKVLGTYDACEQVDEEFCEAWFGNKTGDLYKCRNLTGKADLKWRAPGDPATYAGFPDYEAKITGSFIELADFIDFVNNTDDATFVAGIGERLNVDGFLRAMAVDMVMGQWDGYWIGANNYYLYHDAETGRLEYVPWDLDHSIGMDYWLFPILGNLGTNFATRGFDGWGRSGFGSGLGQVGPPLMRRILDVPQFEAQLQRYAREFGERLATPERLDPRCDELATMLAPYAFQGTFSGPTMENGFDAQDFAEAWTKPANYAAFHTPDTWGIKPFVARRHEYIADHYPVPPPLPPLALNEAMADNTTTIADEAGDFDDWVEIHNTSGVPVSLDGYFLSDRAGDPKAWPFPAGATVPAHGFLVVWCDDEPLEGPLHASFKLSKDGEGVYLYGTDADRNPLVSSLLLPALAPDESYGRLPDGGRLLDTFALPTPLDPNTRGAFELLLDGSCPGPVLISAVDASPAGAVALVYSSGLGSAAVPAGYPCAGTVLGLAAPLQLAATLTADVNGTASFGATLPSAACGLKLQALDLGTCSASNTIQL